VVEVNKTPDKTQPLSHELTLQTWKLRGQFPRRASCRHERMLMSVVAEGRVRPVTLIGVTSGYQEIKRLVVLRGRYFDATDMASRGKVCLITTQLAEKLLVMKIPSGRKSVWAN